MNAIGAIRVVAIVLRADFKCSYCAVRPPKGKRNVDHVIPRCDGGSDRADNLVLACADCNLDRCVNDIPAKAIRYGRSKREIDREVRRQLSISIEPGTPLYERARALAKVWYPEHFARKERARRAWTERAADAFGANREAA